MIINDRGGDWLHWKQSIWSRVVIVVVVVCNSFTWCELLASLGGIRHGHRPLGSVQQQRSEPSASFFVVCVCASQVYIGSTCREPAGDDGNLHPGRSSPRHVLLLAATKLNDVRFSPCARRCALHIAS